jgi:hypothetical protein
MRHVLALVLLFASGCATIPSQQAGDPIAITARAVPLDASDPKRETVGRLRYLGGLELDSLNGRFGGMSSLKWRDGLLHAVSDIGDWFTILPVERGGRLTGARVTTAGDLLAADGSELQGYLNGDAEGLAPDGDGGWLVSFEHEHKLLRYVRLGALAQDSGMNPVELFGPLESNNGIEAIARRNGRTFLCAERLATQAAANCQLRTAGGIEQVRLTGPEGLDPETAFPVDADFAADGTLYVLFRSWSGGSDNRAAIIARSPAGEVSTIATFVRPLTLDNYEGLALREEGGRTFLYIVSDENFRQYNEPARPETWQHTYLMKFELLR